MRKPNNFLIKYEYKSDFFGVECNDGAKHGMRKRVVCYQKSNNCCSKWQLSQVIAFKHGCLSLYFSQLSLVILSKTTIIFKDYGETCLSKCLCIS